MATSQVITIKGHTVEWTIKDASGVAGATGDIYWCETVGGVQPSGDDTGTYWMVQKVIFVPSTAQTTGGFVRIFEESTGGPELVRFNMMINESDVQVYDWDTPHRCRPVYASTLSPNALTTGCKFIWHLV